MPRATRDAIVFACGAVAVAVAPNIVWLFAALTGLGLAASLFHPVGLALLSLGVRPSSRGRAMGIFYATGATAGIIGGPLAASLLQLNGVLGIDGWRWIFLAEGLPAESKAERAFAMSPKTVCSCWA